MIEVFSCIFLKWQPQRLLMQTMFIPTKVCLCCCFVFKSMFRYTLWKCRGGADMKELTAGAEFSGTLFCTKSRSKQSWEKMARKGTCVCVRDVCYLSFPPAPHLGTDKWMNRQTKVNSMFQLTLDCFRTMENTEFFHFLRFS